MSYGCENWGTLCSGNLQPGLEGKSGLQIAFFRHILRRRIGTSTPVGFAEQTQVLWQRTCWSQVLGFMPRLDSMAEGSLHPDILSDNNHDAHDNPGCYNWAAGVQKQYARLGMTSPFSGGLVHNFHHLAFRKAMLAWDTSFWEGLSEGLSEGLHILPHGAPSWGAKLCT